MSFYTYILASRPYGTLYTGSTDDLAKRVWEHREKLNPGFTAKYDVHRLVWFEIFISREEAFRRERCIKKWNRAWKVRLIEAINPAWENLDGLEIGEIQLGSSPSRTPKIPLIPAKAGTQAKVRE